MAYLWWDKQEPIERIQRCGLGKPKTQTLNIRIFIPLWDTGAISWSSKKQQIVAQSSTEAEYIAQTHAAKEGVWLKAFTEEVCGTRGGAMLINCDNQGAIALVKDNKFHSQTKHIDIRYHYIRESVENKKISVSYIPTQDNVADIFTKALPRPKFQQLVELLGLKESENGSTA